MIHGTADRRWSLMSSSKIVSIFYCMSNELIVSLHPPVGKWLYITNKSDWFHLQQGLRERFEILAMQRHVWVARDWSGFGGGADEERAQECGTPPATQRGFVHLANALLRNEKGQGRLFDSKLMRSCLEPDRMWVLKGREVKERPNRPSKNWNKLWPGGTGVREQLE